MPTKEKEQRIVEIREILRGAKAVYVSHYSGLSVEAVTDLRKRLRGVQATHTVAKNTLAIRAAKEEGFEALAPLLVGPAVITVSKGDAMAPAKVLMAFAKENDKLVVKGGVIDGKAASTAEVFELASLPTKDELIAKLLGTMLNPLSGLARVLSAIAEKKAAAQPAQA